MNCIHFPHFLFLGQMKFEINTTNPQFALTLHIYKSIHVLSLLATFTQRSIRTRKKPLFDFLLVCAKTALNECDYSCRLKVLSPTENFPLSPFLSKRKYLILCYIAQTSKNFWDILLHSAYSLARIDSHQPPERSMFSISSFSKNPLLSHFLSKLHFLSFFRNSIQSKNVPYKA